MVASTLIAGLALFPASQTPLPRDTGAQLPTGCRVDEVLAELPGMAEAVEHPPEAARGRPAAIAGMDPLVVADSAAARRALLRIRSCDRIGPGTVGLFDAFALGTLHAAAGWRHHWAGEQDAAIRTATEVIEVGRALSGSTLVGGMVGLALEAHGVELLEEVGVARPALPARSSTADVMRVEADAERDLVGAMCSSLWTLDDCAAALLPTPRRPVDPWGAAALAEHLDDHPLAPGEPVPELCGAYGVRSVLADLIADRAALDARLHALGALPECAIR